MLIIMRDTSALKNNFTRLSRTLSFIRHARHCFRYCMPIAAHFRRQNRSGAYSAGALVCSSLFFVAFITCDEVQSSMVSDGIQLISCSSMVSDVCNCLSSFYNARNISYFMTILFQWGGAHMASSLTEHIYAFTLATLHLMPYLPRRRR